MLNLGSAFGGVRKAYAVVNLLVLIGCYFFTQAEFAKAASDEEFQVGLSADSHDHSLHPLQTLDQGPVEPLPSPPARSLWRARADHRASVPDAGSQEPSFETNCAGDDESTSTRTQCLLKRGSRPRVLSLMAFVIMILTLAQFDPFHFAEPPLTDIPSLRHGDAVLVRPSPETSSSGVGDLLQSIPTRSESLTLQFPPQVREQMRDKYSCLEGDVDTTSNFFPDLFKLMSIVDEEFRAHNLSYFISDGTLLGLARHGGIIPWDDDIDVSLVCAGPEEPCWSQLMDPASPFRVALHRRGLGMWIGALEPKRHMLKIFHENTDTHVKDEHGDFTYPYVDIFLLSPVRCNASDSLDSDTWAAGNQLPIGSVKRLEFEKSLRLYDTTIWAYRTDGSRFPPPGRCSVVDHLIPHFLPTEVLPLQRVKLGTVEVNAPAAIDPILKRYFGKWRTRIHRSSQGHVPAALRVERKKPFEPCRVDLSNMSDEDRAWISRPVDADL